MILRRMEGRIKGKRRKGLRSGYTTGACAAAAAKAATIALIYQNKIRDVEIRLPSGDSVRFKVNNLTFNRTHASSSVIKDAGDDPDVTNRAEIKAEVCRLTEDRSNRPGSIILEGGEGVGIVTKPGLPVPIGRPAINPVPEKMILDSVREALEDAEGPNGETFPDRPMRVVISVPKGKELAKRTLNPRLGIVGGISILGTTGIVKPISLDAYRETIKIGIDVASASGLKQIVLTPGRSSEKIAERITDLPKEGYILMGDHAGYSLNYAYKKGVRDIIIVGQLGKLSKIGDGNFATHVKDASINRSKMGEWGREAGLNQDDIEAIKSGNTTREISDYMAEKGFRKFFDIVAREVISSVKRFLNSDIRIRCILISGNGAILADRE